MIELLKIEPTLEGLEWIVRNRLAVSCKNCFEGIVNQIANGEGSLYCWVDRGFMVVRVNEHKLTKHRTLWIDAIEGKQLFNRSCVAIVEELAKRENCCEIRCETRIGRVAIALKKLGFEQLFTNAFSNEPFFQLRKLVNNGWFQI